MVSRKPIRHLIALADQAAPAVLPFGLAARLLALGLLIWAIGVAGTAFGENTPVGDGNKYHAVVGSTAPSTPSKMALASAVHSRATNHFLKGLLLKPIEPSEAGLAATFAPLLMLEANERTPKPGRLMLTHGDTRVAPGLTVYWSMGAVRLNKAEHPQVAFVWVYPTDKKHTLSFQGVRITLDKVGQPAIWEVLRDSSEAAVIYVSSSLEAAAQRSYGKALPGLTYAIERAQHESPQTMVAGVLEDGPVPMGPIVYIEAKTLNISTVICRCMPSQTRELVGVENYALLPLAPILPELSENEKGNRGFLGEPGRLTWPTDDGKQGVAGVLRLPPDF